MSGFHSSCLRLQHDATHRYAAPQNSRFTQYIGRPSQIDVDRPRPHTGDRCRSRANDMPAIHEGVMRFTRGNAIGGYSRPYGRIWDMIPMERPGLAIRDAAKTESPSMLNGIGVLLFEPAGRDQPRGTRRWHCLCSSHGACRSAGDPLIGDGSSSGATAIERLVAAWTPGS
jgi:hypothetical protein